MLGLATFHFMILPIPSDGVWSTAAPLHWHCSGHLFKQHILGPKRRGHLLVYVCVCMYAPLCSAWHSSISNNEVHGRGMWVPVITGPLSPACDMNIRFYLTHVLVRNSRPSWYVRFYIQQYQFCSILVDCELYACLLRTAK